ncbi:hypothetical protein [Desulfobacter vibrioformis]|uniref:hypothetical protein n=1 Tax=Desulfobacter vibrioformis TaxID=34031 RepID=UPI00055923BA|nr:hypothetical protein [Desulfobacter vibrioformis]
MTELHIPTLRRLAEKQLRETGNVSNETLDLIIEDWGIELDRWKDKERGKKVWRQLITLYLLAPGKYMKAACYIKGMSDAVTTLSKHHPKPNMENLEQELKRLESSHNTPPPDIVA